VTSLGAHTLGVVIVTHDTAADVLTALGSLGGLTRRPGRVVVVDCGSSDDTVAAVRTAFPAVDVIELANVGYARGANAGVRRLGDDVSAVLIANADIVLAEDTLAALVAELVDPEVAIVGPRVRYPDGGHQASARRSPGLSTALVHGAIGWLAPTNRATRRYHAVDLTGPQVTAPCDVDWVSGCAFLVRRDAFESLGGFDPGYRLFVEDVDLCDRARAAGHRIRFAPAAVVVHQVGGSTSRRPVRSRVAHAAGLDRYVEQRLPGHMRGLRPLLWPALAGWVLATTTVGWLRRGRSSTGERTGER
jgi:N-acetylglucosaminyl-diphospho-decaprenol L-rhamnosyltransferase